MFNVFTNIIPNIVAGILMLVVGVVVYGMLSSRNLPTVIAFGPIVDGVLRLIGAMLQYFTLIAIINRNIHLAPIMSAASTLLGLTRIIVLAVLIVYGVHVLVKEISTRRMQLPTP